MAKMKIMKLKIIREGIFGALTGGFYFDTSHSHFINIVHIYLWVGLFLFPLTIGLFAPKSYIGWSIYSLIVGVTILVIKFITHWLHHLFDTSAVIEEESMDKDGNPTYMELLEEPVLSPDVELGSIPDWSNSDLLNPTRSGDSQRTDVHHGGPSGSSSAIAFGIGGSGSLGGAAGEASPSGASKIPSIQTEETSGSSSRRKSSLPSQMRHAVNPPASTTSTVQIHHHLLDSPSASNLRAAGTITSNSATSGTSMQRSVSKPSSDYTQKLEALKRDVSKLPIQYDDFQPSTADIDLLDLNPDHRANLNKSISRSRSSSQRQRASLRSMSTRPSGVLASSGGSGNSVMVGGLLGVITGVGTSWTSAHHQQTFQYTPHHHLPGLGLGRSLLTSSPSSTDDPRGTVCRSHSLRQAVAARRLQQQQLPGRRTQSFRRDEVSALSSKIGGASVDTAYTEATSSAGKMAQLRREVSSASPLVTRGKLGGKATLEEEDQDSQKDKLSASPNSVRLRHTAPSKASLSELTAFCSEHDSSLASKSVDAPVKDASRSEDSSGTCTRSEEESVAGVETPSGLIRRKKKTPVFVEDGGKEAVSFGDLVEGVSQDSGKSTVSLHSWLFPDETNCGCEAGKQDPDCDCGQCSNKRRARKRLQALLQQCNKSEDESEEAQVGQTTALISAPSETQESPTLERTNSTEAELDEWRHRLVRRSVIRRRKASRPSLIVTGDTSEPTLAPPSVPAPETSNAGPSWANNTSRGTPGNLGEEATSCVLSWDAKRLAELNEAAILAASLDLDGTGGSISDATGLELAAGHDDTCQGSIHFFRDENNQLMVYVFGDGRGAAFTKREWLDRMQQKRAGNKRDALTADEEATMELLSQEEAGVKEEVSSLLPVPLGSSSNLPHRPDSPHPDAHWFAASGHWRRQGISRNRSQTHVSLDDESALMDRQLRQTLTWCDRINPDDSAGYYPADLFPVITSNDEKKNSKRNSRKILYYRVKLFPWWDKIFKIRFDRLQLSALFDRNLTVYEVVFSVFFGMLVSVLAGVVISKGFYPNLSLLAFCACACGCQYCLIKSVQPDAATPQHGFNRLIVFSRAGYFSLLCLLLLISDALVTANSTSPGTIPTLYGVPVDVRGGCRVMREVSSYLLLFLPFIFMMGWLPQANTFTAYLFEQIDIHVFGSSGTASVLSVVFSIFRNLLAIAMSYGVCYGGIKDADPQHVLFSVFWGLHVALSYFLSRLPSNISLYAELKPHSKKSASSTKKNTHKPSATDSISLVKDSLWAVSGVNDISEPTNDVCVGGMKDPATTSTVLSPPTCSVGPSGDTSFNLPANASFTDLPCAVSDDESEPSYRDPLPRLIRESLLARLKNDAVVCLVMGVLTFAVHVSTAFTAPALQPNLPPVAIILTVIAGFLLHYLWPQMRKPYPWLLLAKPIIQPDQNGALLKSEMFYVWLQWAERNILVPLVTMATCTQAVKPLHRKFGPFWASLILIVCSMKMLRNGYQGTPRVFFVLFFAFLFFKFDFHQYSETFPLDYFFMAIAVAKMYELVLKLRFILIYVIPVHISWGSAFHSIAQLSFIPHSMFLLSQCLLSVVLSAPLEPFVASAIFLASYIRPIKFWEQNYNTQCSDATTTSLVAQVEEPKEFPTENMNAIFYEHLTRSLQRSLAGDVLLGRWGAVTHGDVFILASEDLHFLVHIIEVGNGLVTFQLRGLEFVGTYCHEQETEELQSDMDRRNSGFCCCSPGHLPGMLSLNAAFYRRWSAWQVVNTPFFLDGYRITAHSATTSLQLFDFRKLVILFYVQCIVYYTTRLPNLEYCLHSLHEVLLNLSRRGHVDLDLVFNKSLDVDYDDEVNGVSRKKFVEVHLPWIQYCHSQREDNQKSEIECDADSKLVSLCFGLSLLGRRCLGGLSPEKFGHSLEVFLQGLHSVFKGDIRVLTKDDWVFKEIDLLKTVIGPAVRIAIKLYQDDFACANLTEPADLYQAIQQTERDFVICHEAHPMWRFAVLNDADSLFSFRRVGREVKEGYMIIMLAKKKLQFKVVKINSECVRGFWSGQQQEQIFLRNNNPERGSIQHASHVLRNLINSSCDLPIGYPIFVSPLTTSFAGTHPAYSSIVGGGQELSLTRAFNWLRGIWHQVKWRCGETCITHSGEDLELQSFPSRRPRSTSGLPGVSSLRTSSQLGGTPLSSAGILVKTSSSAKPGRTTHVMVHQLAGEAGEGESTPNVTITGPGESPPIVPPRVKIADVSQVLNDKHTKLVWPKEDWRSRLLTIQTSPTPLAGSEGHLIHLWTPSNPDRTRRSFCHLDIALIALDHPGGSASLTGDGDSKLVVIYEKGLRTIDVPTISTISFIS